MVDVPGVTRFLLNGRMIGDVQGSAALGAQIGIMAYDTGVFAITDFNITSDGQNVPTQPVTPSQQTGGAPQTADTGAQTAPQNGGNAPQPVAGSGAPQVRCRSLAATAAALLQFITDWCAAFCA